MGFVYQRSVRVGEEPRGLSVIRGGNDPWAGERLSEDERRHRLRRLVAAHTPAPLHVGPSIRATCMVCGLAIATGALQYDITVGQLTITVDESCYMSTLRDVVEDD